MQIESNYAKAVQFVQDAAGQGAHLAVLPEYHLTNWVPHDAKFSDLCGQWEIYLNRYRALAKEHNICIVPGTIVERHQDEKTGDHKLINVAYFIDNKGEILGRYQKKNLWHGELPYLTSSAHEPHNVIQTPVGPVGLLICWDLSYPEAFRELITAGAKIIIAPTFWTLSAGSAYGRSVNPRYCALFIESTITARTFENTCAVVFANAGGRKGSQSLNYAGLSRVAVPFLEALGEETKNSSEEGMSVVDLDMKHVEQAEATLHVRENLANEDWYYHHRGRAMTGREKL
ncbi:MAG: hypothetical protein LQ344_000863 [Seirophora lacunosa]|nr:MAG: hypothetical protein LQ344_000863 [Seirophora lacunosa]